MRNLFAFFVVVALLCTTSSVFAEQNGVYVAPKFVYSYQRIENADIKVESLSDRLKTEKDSTFGGAIAVGYDFKSNFGAPVRAEIEYALRSESEGEYSESYSILGSDVRASGSMKFVVHSVFLNMYYDIETGTPFTPYIGGGLGVAFVDAEGNLDVIVDGSEVYDESNSKGQTNFAFNLAAGLGYDVNENFTLDLGYRYADFGEAETGDVGINSVDIKGEARVVAHEVLFGLRYAF